jgi:hypothetical protein
MSVQTATDAVKIFMPADADAWAYAVLQSSYAQPKSTSWFGEAF